MVGLNSNIAQDCLLTGQEQNGPINRKMVVDYRLPPRQHIHRWNPCTEEIIPGKKKICQANLLHKWHWVLFILSLHFWTITEVLKISYKYFRPSQRSRKTESAVKVGLLHRPRKVGCMTQSHFSGQKLLCTAFILDYFLWLLLVVLRSIFFGGRGPRNKVDSICSTFFLI